MLNDMHNHLLTHKVTTRSQATLSGGVLVHQHKTAALADAVVVPMMLGVGSHVAGTHRQLMYPPSPRSPPPQP